MSGNNSGIRHGDLWRRDYLLHASRGKERVRAFTVDGVQCGLSGLGEGENRLSFPAHFDVGSALSTDMWVRFANEDELKTDATWWRSLGFTPKAALHCNSTIADPNDPMGMHGSTITVLAQQRVEEFVSKEPNVNLEEVPTPEGSVFGD